MTISSAPISLARFFPVEHESAVVGPAASACEPVETLMRSPEQDRANRQQGQQLRSNDWRQPHRRELRGTGSRSTCSGLSQRDCLYDLWHGFARRQNPAGREGRGVSQLHFYPSLNSRWLFPTIGLSCGVPREGSSPDREAER